MDEFLNQTLDAINSHLAESKRAEIDRVYRDPSHPMHAKWHAGEPEGIAYVENLHKELTGGR